MIVMYLKSMGGLSYWLVACLVFALQPLAQVGTNVWIRAWANAYGERQEYSTRHVSTNGTSMMHLEKTFGISQSCVKIGSCLWPMSYSLSSRTSDVGIQSTSYDVDDGYYLGIYAVICIIFMLVTMLNMGWLFYGSITASRRIHHKLIGAVLHAKFRFFDSTPLGQIMNRFSKDIELVDQEIAPVAEGVLHCLLSIITIIILISAIMPRFLIAAVFISIMYALIGNYYINSSRDLKRLESVQRSPLYQQFGETLSGMTTIRAYGDERRFARENVEKINAHSRPFIFLWAANRWLAFRVDIVGALVSFSTSVFVILSVGRVDAGAAGLAMTYAVTFTENVLWFVRLYSMNEQNMNAIERIKEYFDVEQEAPPVVQENRPPSNWPSKGSVELIGYSTRYRKDFDYVLKDITFKIAPGEKVGVVGRTGAGKSSLALALFRALEAEEGKVLIDDVDIGLIGLQDLRENIVMVPQGEASWTSAKGCARMLTSRRSDALHRHNSQQPRPLWPLHGRRNLLCTPPGPAHRQPQRVRFALTTTHPGTGIARHLPSLPSRNSSCSQPRKQKHIPKLALSRGRVWVKSFPRPTPTPLSSTRAPQSTQSAAHGRSHSEHRLRHRCQDPRDDTRIQKHNVDDCTSPANHHRLRQSARARQRTSDRIWRPMGFSEERSRHF